ncbi:MAG TPA: ATP-dependent DNA helicase [Micromonosporaceae bacterium]
MSTVQVKAGPRYTPHELARELNLHPPTPEQAAVVHAPVEPLLVVAGAGSGKTETMAARVVWLVANNHVRADQVLGLTFTRKAAGELAHRVRARLAQLTRRYGRDELLVGEPTVATYHSYAARIVTEHGVRAGYEPATRLLSEASCWQLADAIVRSYTGDMSAVDSAPSTVVAAVLQLAADLSEHLVTPDELATWTGRFHAEVASRPGRMYRDVSALLSRQRARLALLPLVRAYTERKRLLEAMDFGDQLAWAAQVATGHPEVGALERDRYRVVLLDEYQDTSHAQVTLLRALFGGGHPVTAVGDPCQSIYGWRGASAGSLDRFPTEFPDRSGAPARTVSLATSWRNRPEILSVANALSRPLRDHGHRVARLSAAPRPAAPAGAATVRCALLETDADEADWIADSIVAAWQHAAGVTGPDVPPAAIPVRSRPTTAVVTRVRAQIPVIETALRARGLPVEIVGLGGLLDTPEVRDVISTLRVLADPSAGPALLRLLTGARWRIGPRDLVALHRRARALADAGHGADGRGADAVTADRLDEATLVEALDDLGEPEQYSPAGYRRFSAFAAELRSLRRRLDQPLPDLLADIERTMGLDVEVEVRTGDAGLARAHLDALGAVAERFVAEAEGATVASFLAYLDAAESEERGLAPGEVEVVEGAVQILTGHAAKGLEWDVVAVAGLTQGVFPGPSRATDHWLGGLGVLPFPLRGDRDGLPALDLSSAADQKDVARALTTFAESWKAHDEREERRLAYVAVTRARRLLLCSGYWWGEGTKRPRGPSPFLTEIRDECLAGAGVVDAWAPAPPDGATNPTAANVARASWPADPLGERRRVLDEAADLVRAAIDRALREPVAISTAVVGRVPVDEAERWAYEVDLLLAERARLTRNPDAPVEVPLSDHVSVSQLVALYRDPAALAARLRRPMPTRPDPYARRGTAFHRWLEQRFAADRLLDIDELPGAADEDAASDDALTELQRSFLASEWADRTPVEVEVPFATVIGDLVVRGRIDAVFAEPDGGYVVVDWKTGRPPPPGRAARAASIQLATYRLAWAELVGVPVGKVSAAFHYVRDGLTVRPVDLFDEHGLVRLVTSVPEATSP